MSGPIALRMSTDVRHDEFITARCSCLVVHPTMTVAITKSSDKQSSKRGHCHVGAPRVGHETSIRVFLPAKKNPWLSSAMCGNFVRFGAVTRRRG